MMITSWKRRGETLTFPRKVIYNAVEICLLDESRQADETTLEDEGIPTERNESFYNRIKSVRDCRTIFGTIIGRVVLRNRRDRVGFPQDTRVFLLQNDISLIAQCTS